LRRFVFGLFFVVLAALGVGTASPAAAQSLASTPAAAGVTVGGSISTTPASASLGTDAAAQGRVLLAAGTPCGFFTRGSWSYYNHCGPTAVRITVSRWFGAFKHSICVWPGVTELTNHWGVQGSFITGAWYTGRC
jgi:hypothetical protein